MWVIIWKTFFIIKTLKIDFFKDYKRCLTDIERSIKNNSAHHSRPGTIDESSIVEIFVETFHDAEKILVRIWEKINLYLR
jgi:hypothetical protein